LLLIILDRTGIPERSIAYTQQSIAEEATTCYVWLVQPKKCIPCQDECS
jgi:hypothetical protein